MKYILNAENIITSVVDYGQVFIPEGYSVVQTNDPRTMAHYAVDESIQDEIEQRNAEFIAALKPYKIWDMVDKRINPLLDPTPLDYKTGLIARLHPKNTFTKGELINVQYYRHATPGAYLDLFIDVDIRYFRDESGAVTHRRTTRKWTTVDGKYGPHVKVTEKAYDPKEASREGGRRRENIVDGLRDNAQQLGVMNYVQTMFRTLDSEIGSYEKTGDTKIIEKIGAYVGAWLDDQPAGLPATLRQLIIAELTL